MRASARGLGIWNLKFILQSPQYYNKAHEPAYTYVHYGSPRWFDRNNVYSAL
jgi:hypothetical protein